MGAFKAQGLANTTWAFAKAGHAAPTLFDALAGEMQRPGRVEAFDPQTNTWTVVTSLGTARNALGLAVLRGKLYAVGGEGADGEDVATVEAYDPEQNRWEEVAPLPSPRCALAAAAL